MARWLGGADVLRRGLLGVERPERLDQQLLFFGGIQVQLSSSFLAPASASYTMRGLYATAWELPMYTLRFDMRAPSAGARRSELYRCALDMAAWGSATAARA